METQNISQAIIDHLNNVLGTKYRAENKETKKCIDARIKEGYTLEDFKKVIDSRYAEWGNDPKMKQYIRPATLFGNKFESYLQHALSKPAIKKPTQLQGLI